MTRRLGLPVVVMSWFWLLLAGPWARMGQDPFVISNAAKRTPTIDGDPSEWASSGSDTLQMSWAHNERSGTPDSEPLVVDITYAWDDTNFYTLVQEVSGNDPTTGINDAEWCRECNGPDLDAAAPWSTDSIGFYDNGIRWPNGEQDPILEVGPYTQWWGGLTTEHELVINGEKQYRHLVRTITEGGAEGDARLIGPRSEESDGIVPMHENLPEVTAVWFTGDFNGDGRTNSSDLVAGLADGGYELGPPPPAAAVGVPEPSSLAMLCLGLLALARSRTRPACGKSD